MIDATNLSVDNKPVKWMTFNGSIVYSTTPDYTTTTLALESTTLSTSGLDSTLSGTYTLPDGVSYSYQVYDTPMLDLVKEGSGQTNPFCIAPHVWCRAKHYNSQLTSFDDPYSDEALTVKEQIALTAWAEAHGLALPAEDISDIEMIETNEAYGGTEDTLPCLMDFI